MRRHSKRPWHAEHPRASLWWCLCDNRWLVAHYRILAWHAIKHFVVWLDGMSSDDMALAGSRYLDDVEQIHRLVWNMTKLQAANSHDKLMYSSSSSSKKKEGEDTARGQYSFRYLLSPRRRDDSSTYVEDVWCVMSPAFFVKLNNIKRRQRTESFPSHHHHDIRWRQQQA